MNILQVTRSMRVPQLVKISNVVDLVRVKGYKIHKCPQVMKLQINNHNVKAYKNYEQIQLVKLLDVVRLDTAVKGNKKHV